MLTSFFTKRAGEDWLSSPPKRSLSLGKKELMKIFWTSLLLGMLALEVSGQTYLVVDRYGKNRHKMVVGAELHFRLKGEKIIRHDVITSLSPADSMIGLAKARTKIHLNRIDRVYFYRQAPKFIQASGAFVGTGFVTAAAVHPLVSNAQYNARESLVIGSSILGLSQLSRFFNRSSIKMGRRGRIQIIEIRWEGESDTGG